MSHDAAVSHDCDEPALSLAERAVLLNVLEDPPPGLVELRAVLLNDHQWRKRTSSIRNTPNPREGQSDV